MMIRVDECSNEDPGPLPGPRYLGLENLERASNMRFEPWRQIGGRITIIFTFKVKVT